MPMAVAMRRAPRAIVVPPRMTAYEEASDAIFAILSTVTPLIEPLYDGQAIYRAASALLLAEKLKQKARLTGVSAQRLLSQGGQLPLFDSDCRAGRLNAALDRIHDKFGSAALTTADLHETPTKKRE